MAFFPFKNHLKPYRFNKLFKLLEIAQVNNHFILNFNSRIDFDDLIIMVPNVIGYGFEDSFSGHKKLEFETSTRVTRPAPSSGFVRVLFLFYF